MTRFKQAFEHELADIAVKRKCVIMHTIEVFYHISDNTMIEANHVFVGLSRLIAGKRCY